MAKKIVDETLKFNIIINGDDAKKEYGQLERANRKLLDSNKDLEKQAKSLEKANQQNSEEYKSLRAEIDKNANSVKGNKTRMGELTEEIGLTNLTMRQLRKEYGKLNGIMSNLDPNSPEWAQYNAELKQVKGRMSELRGEMKATEEVMDDQINILGQFGAGFTQIFTGIKSGNYKEASQGFEIVGGGIKSATKAAIAFIATPIGATLAILAGIGFIAKQWFNYNENIKESVILTEQITRLQGEQAEAIRLRNEAMKNTFGTEEKEQLEIARNLVEQFGISYEEAFDTIEAGLVRGQKNNNEYFDSLREYPAFFSAAGYSAQEFRNVIETGYNLGIYNDKLPDAIKEFNISISEQTKATRESLVNAFGQTFTDDLLKRVKIGETSTKDALQEVSKEAERLGLNIEQNQRLTADVFRGAGEDAGGAIKVFEAMNVAANLANKALTPLEQSTKDLADANLELETAQSKALKGDNYISFTRELQMFWAKTKTLFYNGIEFISDVFTNSLDFLVVQIASIAVTAGKLPSILIKGIKNVSTSVLDTIKTFGGLGDVIYKILNLDFSGAKESAVKFKNDFKANFADIKTSATETIDEIIATKKAAEQIALNQIQKKREGNVASVNANSPENTEAERQKALDEAAEAERQKALDEVAQTERQKAIDEAIRKKQSVQEAIDKFDEEQSIRDQLKQVEKDERTEEEQVIRKQLEFEKLEAEAAGDVELLAQLEIAEQNEIQAIRDSFADERLAKEEKQKADLLAQEERFKEQTLTAERNFQDAKRNMLNSGLNTMQQIFGQESIIGKAAFLFQKGKAIATIVQQTAAANAAITSSLAIANSIAAASSPLTFGMPWVAVNTANAAKNTATNNINAAVQIAVIAGSALQGFEDGLYPVTRKQDGKRYKAAYRNNTSTGVLNEPTILAGERPEMIIDPDTFRSMDQRVVDYILQLAGKRPMQGFESGDYSKTKATQSQPIEESQNNNNNNNMIFEGLNETISQLKDILEAGIVAKSFYGLEEEIQRKEVENKLNAINKASKN
ncbi:hypothetical protein ES692_06200 [Psychroserpens burtonensis]|uniref:Phage tail tape measure protein domain-containing protein n=1 Tax=Psychroserpens burtonensis TaxID=49278 RepID=A0A5C7BBS6_9FLAO|nr:phage tail tape measure protein [Psychroserpens burtonensis]TXE18633.1 hypothetical protein ES692_06200 [Psychroserpens burtonensis]